MEPYVISDTDPGMSYFLWICGTAFLLGSALPLLFAPAWWGRRFGWAVEKDRSGFTTYLGRCLGGAALGLVYGAYRAAPAPEAHPLLIEILLLISAVFAVVHIVGHLQRRQPWFESVEIAMYLGICAVGGWLHWG